MSPLLVRRLALLASSSLLALLLSAGAYEAYAQLKYRSWRATFDNHGWFGKVIRPSDNPVLLWEYVPYGEFQGHVLNRYGFRDVDLETPRKPPGQYRVAFVGDSVTLGMSAPQEAIFPRRVGAIANAEGASFTSLGFGVDGYDALQVGELLRARVLEFEPDRVVYVHCLNDFDFQASSGEKRKYFAPPASFFWQKVRLGVGALLYPEFHERSFRWNRDAVFEAIRAMRRDAEAAGADFRVALMPIFPESPASFERYPAEALHAAVGAFLDAEGIPTLDLLGVYRATGQAPGELSTDIWHPNAAGHEVAARALVPFVAP